MKFFLSLLLMCVFTTAFSQTIKYEGIVKDTTNVPLEMANVMAVNQATKAVDSYSITNDKGRFVLNLNVNATYNVRFSYLGLKPKTIAVTTKTTDITQNVTLISDSKQLNEVEIVREMPISVKGDTIIYKADAFKNGTERKLEDVLKKLPGVEVTKDGEIQVEGKKVQKVMVEGKDFFDGDTKIATKNIPADALDKIQVLRNYNEVSNLKGLENNEENVALNIKLKEGKKNFWFGDLTAGIGVGHEEDRHLLNPKLFYYNPKYSINVIGNFNNIGELPLTAQDYFKFTGGFKNFMKKGGTNFNVASNDLGVLGLRNNRAASIDTKFGAANFSYNPSKSLSFSGFGIYSSNVTQIRTDTKTTGLPNNQEEIKSEISNQDNKFGLFKLSSSYVPSTKVHFDYDGLLKFTDQIESSSLNSSLLSDIYTDKKQKPRSFNQNLNYYYTLNDKHVFAAELQHLYQNEDPFYNANLKQIPVFANLLSGYNIFQSRNNLTQNRLVTTSKFDGKFDYYYMLTPKSNLNLTIGNTFSNQNFNSSVFQTLDNGSLNTLIDQKNNNDVTYRFNDVFIAMHYKFLLKKFTFNPGFSVHKYQTNDTQLGTSNKNSFNRILPDFYALWQIKKSETLSYNFSVINNFTDINKLAEGTVFSSYNSIFRGNRYLENSLSQVHSLRYFRYNMFNFENIFANITYSKQINPIKNRVNIIGINQISSATNMSSNFADENFMLNGNYSRSFKRYYKASFGANFNWNLFNNIRVGLNNLESIQTTKSVVHSYNLGFSTNFKKLPNFDLGYSYSINDNFSDKFFTHSPSVKLEYSFLDNFSFTTEYTYFNNSNSSKSIKSEYEFLEANLMYNKKGSKWEWKISGTNLLNTTALNDSSFNQLGGFSSFSSYYVQPRYLILSVKYAL
ncbi:MAG: carboxypeptidase-like regulatory domain-containing protein [Limnohabitans sp.]|nr:carboxypeptidase-like regulatory domain-containing protein [Limnohabitans sp.]